MELDGAGRGAKRSPNSSFFSTGPPRLVPRLGLDGALVETATELGHKLGDEEP